MSRSYHQVSMNNCSQDYNFIKFADYMIINIYMKGGMWPSRILLKITFVKLILILWYDTVSWFTMVLDLLTLLHTISFFATRTLLLCHHLWYPNFSLKIMTDWFIDWLESCFCLLLISLHSCLLYRRNWCQVGFPLSKDLLLKLSLQLYVDIKPSLDYEHKHE